MLTEKILFLDETLHEVTSQIDLTLINPTNAETIKRNYKGKNPKFKYPEIPDFTKVKEKLQKLRFPRTTEGKILKKKQLYLLNKVALIMAIGTPEFNEISKKIHPLPTKKLVKQAQKILTTQKDSNTEKVRLMDAYAELQETIKELDIPWRVQKINMLAGASVMASTRLIYIKRKTLFNRRFIERLKIHEIGTHVVRAENGRLQPLKIFRLGFANYLATEEGLAAFNEDRFGLLDTTVLRTYAGRVLAVHMSQNHTFSEIVEELKKHFSEKKSLTIALRAKRGVGKGTDMGGYTKDAAYLKGFLALKEYEAQGGDFAPLYYGKVGLEDLPLLKKLDWLVEPKYFPEMITLKDQNGSSEDYNQH